MRTSFKAALFFLEQGRKIRRARWDEGLYIQLHKGEPRYFYQNELLDVELDAEEEESLSLSDVFAKDWEVVE